jgi:hypothetical protein
MPDEPELEVRLLRYVMDAGLPAEERISRWFENPDPDTSDCAQVIMPS